MRKLPADRRVTGADVNRMAQDLLHEMQIICGPGLEIRRASGGRVISLMKHPLDRAHTAVEAPGGSGENVPYLQFPAEVLGSTPVTGVENAWLYTVRRVRKAKGGYQCENLTSMWSALGTETRTARNFCENTNSDSGVQGNGVDVSGADWPAGFAIQPCPTGAIVWVVQVPVASDAAEPEYEYWFNYPNGVDGECEETE